MLALNQSYYVTLGSLVLFRVPTQPGLQNSPANSLVRELVLLTVLTTATEASILLI